VSWHVPDSSPPSGRYFLRVHESGQRQLAVTAPVGEGQTRPTRRRTATRRLVTVVAVAALTIGLFFAYLLQSRTQAANSDAADMVVQGWDMLHGNPLLRGWVMADVSFYTFEVPLDGLISVAYGLRADVVHVAAAAEYALLVLFAALLAAGAGRDRRRGAREAWVRGLIAAGVMVAPGANPGAHVLLLGPDHTQIGVPVLAALLVVDRVRPSRLLRVLAAALLVCLLLIWAQLDDPVAEFSCAVPLALACAAPLAAVPFRRVAGHIRARRGEPAAPPLPWRGEARLHGYDLALVVAAVASFGLTQLFIKAINNAGGYYLHAIPAKSQISHWSTVPSQVKTFGQNLMYLFGANFWIKPQVLTNFAYLHLVGVAVALIGLVVALWSWPRADRVTRTLVVAVVAVFAAGAISPLSQPISGAHEIAIILPLSAALAGRVIGPWLAGRPRAVRPQAGDAPGEADGDAVRDGADGQAEPAPARPGPLGRLAPTVRMAVACVLVAAGIGYLWNLSYNASKPSHPAVDQSLADWLVAHHLTSGIGGYWDANVTALNSGGKVTIAPLVDAARYGYLWEAKTAWFDPRVSSANFAIAHVQQLGAGYLFVPTVIHHYGRPEREYHLGRTVVMVYDYNLLTRVIQPTPDHLYGPPKVAGKSAPSPAGALGRV
jgi:hypothetical protein